MRGRARIAGAVSGREARWTGKLGGAARSGAAGAVSAGGGPSGAASSITGAAVPGTSSVAGPVPIRGAGASRAGAGGAAGTAARPSVAGRSGTGAPGVRGVAAAARLAARLAERSARALEGPREGRCGTVARFGLGPSMPGGRGRLSRACPLIWR